MQSIFHSNLASTLAASRVNEAIHMGARTKTGAWEPVAVRRYPRATEPFQGPDKDAEGLSPLSLSHRPQPQLI